MSDTLRIRVSNAAKSFTLHLQGGTVLPVLGGVSFEAHAGDCVALMGASGTGKSTLMRMIYGNYACPQGAIEIMGPDGMTDMATADPRTVRELRRTTLGYVSQFLRVVPRVPALDVAAEPMIEMGMDAGEAHNRARALFARLNLPERLWSLPPATFSGGEQQRVNLARGFGPGYPVLLLDEPTSALDAANREVVMQLIEEARAAGTALIGIFHDKEVRDRVVTREVDLTKAKPAAA